MARASTPTLLPLDRFAQIMGVNPLHFNGVAVQDIAPASVCGQPIMQYAWQTADGLSREDIAQAISDAEERLTQYLGFKPLPQFETDERHNIIKPAQPDLLRYSMAGPAGLGIPVQLNRGHLIAGGIPQLTAIALNSAVTWTDVDADGYKETATFTVNGYAGTDVNEIVAFAPGATTPDYEIRPIAVKIALGVLTVTAKREQLVIPTLNEGFGTGVRAVDGADDTKFLPNIDIYQNWHDPSQQVQFLWESPLAQWGCWNDTCQTCWLSAQFGCTVSRDYRLGLITGVPASWNSVTQAYETADFNVHRAPDRARFWYRAGYQDTRRARPMREMAPQWERAIAYMATCAMNRPMCACQPVMSFAEYWNQDLAVSSGGQGLSYHITKKWLDNPIGTKRGEMQAWRIIRNEALGEGV